MREFSLFLFVVACCFVSELNASESHFKRQAGSGRVGDACSFNTDCLGGMFCNAGICTCLTTYIAAESYCYQKIDPGQPGCVYNEQCNSVWPEAYCDTSAGVGKCRCGDGKVERATRDGHVCLDVNDANGNTLAITCPLPEGAGYTSALSDPEHPRQNDGPGPVLCNTDSTVTSQTLGTEEMGNGDSACLFPSDNSFLADIYDCVEFVSVMDLSSAGYSDNANGICCPNRAFTCVQPTATGPNPSEPRWWYNTVTGMCQQFLWDPAASGSGEHSPNNFRTVEHCESYCRDACSRGSPEYDTRGTFIEENPITGCSQGNNCGNNFECKTIGSIQWCCPTVLSICGAQGGRPLDPTIHTRGVIYHAGVQKQGTAPSTRFHYDPVRGKCSAFTYNGAGGNYNNFLSRIDCELFCSRLQCDRGNPLRIGEVTQTCQSNNDCPSSHECKIDQSVCCPKMQTICTQPLRVGNCDRSVRRYWYSAATRECQSFEYTGCQGNDNNFENLVDCQTFCRNAAPEPRCLQGQAYKDGTGKFVQCSSSRTKSTCPANYECYFDGNMHGCCPTKAYTCSLPSNSGITCGPGISYKYYYNPTTMECESFEYLGCDGNSNNFATRSECESFCGVGGCTNGGTPLRDNSGVLVSCSDRQDNCPPTHECQMVVIGNAKSSRCCPSRAYICGLPPQQGSSLCSGGLSVVSRYYFNIVTKKCSSFIYNGCDGNPNNFASHNQCNNFCHAAACNAGDVVYLNPNTQEPIKCNDELQNNCPRNYQCQYDSLTDQNVCCGATDMGVCPEGEKAYINAIDLTVRECLINEQHSCPEDYLCRFNPQKNRYFCCSSISKVKNYCPTGRAPYKDPNTHQPSRCTMNSANSGCIDGFSCQSELSGALQGYCCSVNDICPNREEYFIDENSAMPRACTIGQFITCPTGFTCMASYDGQMGYCCKGQPPQSPSDGCPPGEIVYMEKNQVVSCDPFNSANSGCPGGFSCQWSVQTQRYQCCGTESLPMAAQESDGCPSRQIAFTDPVTSKPKVCTSATFSCPTGYFCQFSVANKQFQCCGIAASCPASQVAFIGMDGEPQICNLNGGAACPEGFSCVKGRNGRELCCAGNNPCTRNQVHEDGECHEKAEIGEKCQYTSQCQGGSTCRNRKCRCPKDTKEEEGECVAIPQELKCRSDHVPVDGACLPLAKIGNSCSSTKQCQGQSLCQFGICSCEKGSVIQNGRCVIRMSSRKAPKKDDEEEVEEEAEEVEEQEKVETTTVAERRPKTTRKPINKLRKQGTVVTNDVCPHPRKQYLFNGKPQNCINGRPCAIGYKCTYSKKAQGYFCCSAPSAVLSVAAATVNQGKSSAATAAKSHGCPTGNALLFPSTKQPVVCPHSEKCPQGYVCLPSTVSGVKQCCSVTVSQVMRRPMKKAKSPSMSQLRMMQRWNEMRRGKAPAPRAPKQSTRKRGDTVAKVTVAPETKCPSYMVLVESRSATGKMSKRCQTSCPYDMTPIAGVCKPVLKKT